MSEGIAIRAADDPITRVGKLLHALPISYNGSKQRIFPWVADVLLRESVGSQVAVDGFSGSGIISAVLAASGLDVYACDTLGTAYAMTVMMAANPGITMTDEQLGQVTSHAAIDGLLYDDVLGLMDDAPGMGDAYSGLFTRNEGIWMCRTRDKLLEVPIYERLIGHCALRALVCIQPFGTPNGRSTFPHRIKQKRTYGTRCLGHYLNSSYEIEVEHWFRRYVGKLNVVVEDLSSHRLGHTTCYRMDVLELLESVAHLDVGMAYFDPPYGGRGCRDYGIDYRVHEHIIGSSPIPAADFFTAKSHALRFEEILDRCEGIPTLIFSYNNKAWTTVEDIMTRLRRRGYDASMDSTGHVHGKHPIEMSQNRVTEHLIIARR